MKNSTLETDCKSAETMQSLIFFLKEAFVYCNLRRSRGDLTYAPFFEILRKGQSENWALTSWESLNI